MKAILLLLARLCAKIDIFVAPALDTAKIDNLTGLKGKWNEREQAYRVTFPSDDVNGSRC